MRRAWSTGAGISIQSWRRHDWWTEPTVEQSWASLGSQIRQHKLQRWLVTWEITPSTLEDPVYTTHPHLCQSAWPTLWRKGPKRHDLSNIPAIVNHWEGRSEVTFWKEFHEGQTLWWSIWVLLTWWTAKVSVRFMKNNLSGKHRRCWVLYIVIMAWPYGSGSELTKFSGASVNVDRMCNYPWWTESAIWKLATTASSSWTEAS